MKKKIFGRKLKRTTKERKALFRSLVSSLILKGQIKTTEAKAKSVKGEVDKIINLAKKGTLAARRELLTILDPQAVGKLLNGAAAGFSKRSSGFTQIIKIGPRKGDNAPMVFLRLIEAIKPPEVTKETEVTKRGGPKTGEKRKPQPKGKIKKATS